MSPSSKIVAPSERSLARAASLLRQGLLIGLPTETVYGLAADGTNVDAVGAIYRAKGRPANNPLILHVDTPEKARRLFVERWSDQETRRWERLSRLWPGPLTIIGRKHPGVLMEVTAGGDTVAVRIPSHPVARRLLARVDFPVAAPSANVSNYVSPTTARHVADGLGRHVAMVLDGGACEVGLESTIVTLGREDESVKVLRSGGITREVLADVLNESVVAADRRIEPETDRPAEILSAPGQLSQHYSPKTPLIMVDPERTVPVSRRSLAASSNRSSPPARISNAEETDTARVLRITFFPPSQPMNGYAEVRVLSLRRNWRDVATKLYAELRRADQSDFNHIEIDRCEADGIGQAIADRLNRAVHNHLSAEDVGR